MDAILDRRCLTCAWFRVGDTPGIGWCKDGARDVAQDHVCLAWRSTAHGPISTAAAALRHLLLLAAAHPQWPTDATILTAEAVREIAEQWREAAALLNPAVACTALRIAAELETLATAAERAAPFLPTPSPEATA